MGAALLGKQVCLSNRCNSIRIAYTRGDGLFKRRRPATVKLYLSAASVPIVVLLHV